MALQDRRDNLWAVVLVAGEGKRLSTLTRALVPRHRSVVVVPENLKTLRYSHLRAAKVALL